MQSALSVDDYLEKHAAWRPELGKLRRLLLSTELVETIKWGGPCYSLDGKNVVGMAAFKQHVALWFYQGVFMGDPLGVLVNAQEGVTKALRQWRFEQARAIVIKEVKAYVLEAIENQRLGRVLKAEPKATLAMPAPLAIALGKSRKLKACFEALTPGRRREYMEYIDLAKREATKSGRVAKILPLIEAGVGLNDKYRKG